MQDKNNQTQKTESPKKPELDKLNKNLTYMILFIKVVSLSEKIYLFFQGCGF